MTIEIDANYKLAQKAFVLWEKISELDTFLWDLFYTDFLTIIEEKEKTIEYDKQIEKQMLQEYIDLTKLPF